jgi:hypothetical protein
MKVTTDFLDFLSFSDARRDEEPDASRDSQRKGKRTDGRRVRGASAKKHGQRPALRDYTAFEASFEVVPLGDDWSALPGTQSHNYYLHPHFERERSKQRAIRMSKTIACLHYGDDTWQAEATHRMVTDNSIAAAARDGFDISSLRGLTLILIGRRSNVIKTGYKVPGSQRGRAA